MSCIIGHLNESLSSNTQSFLRQTEKIASALKLQISWSGWRRQHLHPTMQVRIKSLWLKQSLCELNCKHAKSIFAAQKKRKLEPTMNVSNSKCVKLRAQQKQWKRERELFPLIALKTKSLKKFQCFICEVFAGRCLARVSPSDGNAHCCVKFCHFFHGCLSVMSITFDLP